MQCWRCTYKTVFAPISMSQRGPPEPAASSGLQMALIFCANASASVHEPGQPYRPERRYPLPARAPIKATAARLRSGRPRWLGVPADALSPPIDPRTRESANI
jgi:hypothetical protein